MKKIMYTLSLILALSIVAGCGTATYEATKLPAECQVSTTTTVTVCDDSFILNHFSNPSAIKSAAGAAVLIAVKSGEIKAADVLKVTAIIRAFLAADNSYSGLGSLLTSVVNSDEIDTVVTVLEATGVFSALADMGNVSIGKCDVALMDIALDYVDGLVEPYAD